jgi:hypothetical protein
MYTLPFFNPALHELLPIDAEVGRSLLKKLIFFLVLKLLSMNKVYLYQVDTNYTVIVIQRCR